MTARFGVCAVMTMWLWLPHGDVCAAADPVSEKRGYWWYQEDKPREESVATKEHTELPRPPPTETLMTLHPDELRDMQAAYLKQAVWKPTTSHVRDYYIVQDAIRRKALAMAAVSQVVMLEHPELNVARENPVTNPGRVAATQLRQGSSRSLLERYRSDYALLFFTQKGCPYCAAQREALNLFAGQYGWQVKEIDKDENAAMAAQFGATNFVPITILIERASDKHMPVAVGVESVTAIEENTYRAVRLMRGEITPEQFFTMDYQEGGVFDPVIRKGVYR